MIERSIALLTLNSRGLGRICGGISASNTPFNFCRRSASRKDKLSQAAENFGYTYPATNIFDLEIQESFSEPLSVTAGVTRSLERHIFRRRLVEGCVPEGSPNSYAGDLLRPRYTMSVHAQSQYLTVAGIGVGTSAVGGRYPRPRMSAKLFSTRSLSQFRCSRHAQHLLYFGSSINPYRNFLGLYLSHKQLIVAQNPYPSP